MNQHYPWAKGLQIPNDVIAVWEMQAAGSDLLRWALANGKILEHIYLDWAKNYYKLPSLSQSFFEQNPNPTLWDKWGRFDWSGTFLPIYEYDGVLYIACLEPPNAFQQQVIAGLNTRTGLLLAPISGMKKWWTIISPVLQMYKQVSGLPPELAQFAEVGKTTPVNNQAMSQNAYNGQSQNNFNGYQQHSQNPVNPYYTQQQQTMNPVPRNGFNNNFSQSTQNSNSGFPNPYQEQSPQYGQPNQAPANPNPAQMYQAPVSPQNYPQQAYQQNSMNPQQVPAQGNFENTNYHYNGSEQVNPQHSSVQNPAAMSAQVNVQNPNEAKGPTENIPKQHVNLEVKKTNKPPESVNEEQVQVAASISMPPVPETTDEAFTMMPDLPPVEPTIIGDMPPTPMEEPLVNKTIPKPIPVVEEVAELVEEEHDDITQVRSLDEALETLEAKHNELLHMDEKNKQKQVSEAMEKQVPPLTNLDEVEFDSNLNEIEDTVIAPLEVASGQEKLEEVKEDVTEKTVEINFDDFKLEDVEETDEEDSAIDLDVDILEDTGIVGLDLSDLNLSSEDNSLLEEEASDDLEVSDDSFQENEIEGLDFSQFDFDDDSSENLRPPSAHLLDSEDDISLENPSFELATEKEPQAIKVEHPTNPENVSVIKDQDTSFGGDLEKQAAHKSLERIAGICSRRMILQMHQGMLKPYHWEGDWSENPNVKNEIELAENSIFKIVCNTKMPYHGYVVRNDVNDRFLDAFNKGKLPDHATLIPVTLNKNVVAVILGFCEKERVDEIDLHLWERYADEYADAILEINRNTMAA